MRVLNSLTVTKIVKGGTLRDILTSFLLQKYKKIKKNSLQTLKYFRKKNNNENFEQCHSAEIE